MDTQQIQRFWVLYTANYFLDEEAEQAIGAVIEGPVNQPFVSVVSFARLGDQKDRHSSSDGRAFVVRPVLGPSARPAMSHGCSSLDAAMAWLEEQKQQLVTDGWIEVDLDPEHDPD